MGQSLKEIAQALHTDKKVQLIYAFNGVGKTRLSRKFKELVSPKNHDGEADESKMKVLYYNAFTEDLFYWDNDLDADSKRKLKIQPNGFTDWILKEQGQERNIVTNFQRYTSNKLTPRFNEEYNEISFSIEGGNEGTIDNIKISRGEESCLIWCVFYSLLSQIVANLNIAEPDERETNQFDDLQYIFIDDPVSSILDFSKDQVKTPNRRRIKEATERYNNFSTEQKNRIPNYISQYCPNLYDATTNKFRISNEKELTELLNTLNQRYYTTEIDGEKRLANSVTKL